MEEIEYKSDFLISPYDMRRIKEFELTKLPEILGKISNEKQKEIVKGIFYNGKYGKYNCKGSSSKDSAYLEFKRRVGLIEVAGSNINAFEQIINNNINLYHGTNSNALPGIIKNGGLLSENESYKNNNPVLTGEEWSRMEGKRRAFISFTDQVDKALNYSLIPPSTKSNVDSFGIIIGLSSDNIKDLETFKVDSDLPELGVMGKVPISKIQTIFAPSDKTDFVSKLLGDTQIQVVSLDLLSSSIDKVKYGENNFKDLAKTRNKSGINNIFNKLKGKTKMPANEKWR